MMQNLPVDELGVHVSGPFSLSAVCIEVLEADKVYTPDVTAEAAAYWKEQLAKKPKLFDGPVWCLDSYDVDDSCRQLKLSLQRSSYSFVLYTHYSTAWQQVPARSRAGACGLTALCETAEGWLVFGKRSSKLGAMPG